MSAKSYKTVAALCAAGIALVAAPRPAMGQALPPQFVWKSLPPLEWKVTCDAKGKARIEDGVLTASCAEPGVAIAEAEIDLSEYDGRPYEICAVIAAKGVGGKMVPYGGLRFAANYLDMTMGGNRTWPNGPLPTGSFGPEETIFTDRTEKTRRKAFVQIGIYQACGEVRCDLSTLRIREPQPLLPLRNRGRIVEYPNRVSSMPLMRGAMIGGMADADAWDTLESWGAKVVRHQMFVRCTASVTNYEAYAAEFREMAAAVLDEAERTVNAAAEHGMKTILDAHFAPGGVCAAALGDSPSWQRDERMFHDRRYADLFVWFWERIAERFAGRSGDIYGYDLRNEPRHLSPAIEGSDLVGLMERTARAVRSIDPDATIIVESMHADPGWFKSLSAIDLDNVIYSVHVYLPHDYTHQGILTPLETEYRWPDESRGWNREFIRNGLKPVIDFQKEHRCRILVGEFSAVTWADGADQYIRDCISIFEELGWDWCYHAYREARVWNVELESVRRGLGADDFRPAADTPRKRALLDGLKGVFASEKTAR